MTTDDAGSRTMIEHDAIRERVMAEAVRFRAKIPQLLSRYRGMWVVFRDGDVVSAHPDEETAYVAGLKQFGPGGGHVVAIVCEPEPVLLSAAIAFGL